MCLSRGFQRANEIIADAHRGDGKRFGREKPHSCSECADYLDKALEFVKRIMWASDGRRESD
jgi:hypothetical protein